MITNLLIDNFPELAKEYNQERNEIPLNKVATSCGKKAWWICSQGHEWESTPDSMTSGKQTCPYCTNKLIIPGFNDLQTLCPAIAKEYHPTKNTISVDNISVKSGRKVWWLGTCGHEWRTSVAHRVNENTGCPYCSNQKVLLGFNDLQTIHPELAKEYHPTKNTIPIDTLITGSNKYVWWLGKCGHEWKTSVAHRINENTGCPFCNKAGESLPEYCIGYYLKLNDIKYFYRHKICCDNKKIEIDFYLPDFSIGIEYDGYSWHKNKIDWDTEKTNKLIQKNINVIRFREKTLPNINNSYNIRVVATFYYTYMFMEEPLKELFKKLNVDNPDIDIQRDLNKIKLFGDSNDRFQNI